MKEKEEDNKRYIVSYWFKLNPKVKAGYAPGTMYELNMCECLENIEGHGPIRVLAAVTAEERDRLTDDHSVGVNAFKERFPEHHHQFIPDKVVVKEIDLDDHPLTGPSLG